MGTLDGGTIFHIDCGKAVTETVDDHRFSLSFRDSTQVAQNIGNDSVGHDALWVLQHLLVATKYKDRETVGHVVRVGKYAHHLWELMHGETCNTIFHAAQLHDLGKVGVPDGILGKTGKLSDMEFALMKSHTVIGSEILSGSTCDLIVKSRRIARSHHECWDGSGYPDRLVGEQIPIEARVTMLADVYDALRMERPYKQALTHDAAVQVIMRGDSRTSPDHFDPYLLDVFSDCHEDLAEIFEQGGSSVWA